MGLVELVGLSANTLFGDSRLCFFHHTVGVNKTLFMQEIKQE
jgi:hypothetical protein